MFVMLKSNKSTLALRVSMSNLCHDVSLLPPPSIRVSKMHIAAEESLIIFIIVLFLIDNRGMFVTSNPTPSPSLKTTKTTPTFGCHRSTLFHQRWFAIL
mmetsp:Transcript_5885/g.14272  ORF Transcript_5885/g.14272 Transcript_5885/m.14272 type:complete len:99 (+) Transcript_5885:337-633(+)